MTRLFAEYEIMTRLHRRPRTIFVGIKLELLPALGKPFSFSTLSSAFPKDTEVYRSFNCPCHIMLFSDGGTPTC